MKRRKSEFRGQNVRWDDSAKSELAMGRWGEEAIPIAIA